MSSKGTLSTPRTQLSTTAAAATPTPTSTPTSSRVPNNSSTPPAARQPDYMDVDLVRRGPLSSAERQHRMSQRLCLVCGQAGHIKATCPKSNSKFGTSKSVRAIQTSDNDDEDFGETIKACY
ncbi:hypothetical protein BASA81_015630 [Batrachochytrium salamandrivorans]|nr:hypothetical protein BASA81_015630 [Batrachochytrium salamandrivorans]